MSNLDKDAEQALELLRVLDDNEVCLNHYIESVVSTVEKLRQRVLELEAMLAPQVEATENRRPCRECGAVLEPWHVRE